MNTKNYRIGAFAVRFRRWSRKGYAVFHSLTANITIGKVSKSICEMSFLKSNGVTNKQALCLLYAGGESEDDTDFPVLSACQPQVEQMLLALVMNNQAAAVAAAPCYKFIY